MAVMDAQALTTDVEGLAFLADVLGAAPRGGERRFPIETWTPATRVIQRARFGAAERLSKLPARIREVAE